MTGPEIVVLSPHRDDAALSLGATLDGMAGRGLRITVVNCFSISNWAPNLAGAEGSADLVNRVRRQEDQEFIQALGRGARMLDLELLDAPLRRPDRAILEPPSEADAADVGLLARRLGETLHAALVLAPLGLGGHVDHLVTRAAALVAGAGRLAFYEDLPYVLFASDAEVAAEVEKVTAALGEPLQPWYLPHLEPLAAWKRGVSCYRSQLTAGQVDAMVDALRLRRRERLWGTTAVVHHLPPPYVAE
jgi:LmbE family N-acetylglucosaminyl deacetylase